MENFIKNVAASVLIRISVFFAYLAVRIVKNGKIDIEIDPLPTEIDWDCVLGALILFVGVLIFWFITP